MAPAFMGSPREVLVRHVRSVGPGQSRGRRLRLAARGLADVKEARVTRRAEAAAAADVAGVAEVVFRSVIGDAGWDGLSEAVKEIFVANGPAILAELRGGVLDVDAGQLRTIRRPTLVVAARASQPEFAEPTALMAEAIPTARVEWVDGDHLIHPAHPVVLAFVDEVRSRAPADAVMR